MARAPSMARPIKALASLLLFRPDPPPPPSQSSLLSPPPPQHRRRSSPALPPPSSAGSRWSTGSRPSTGGARRVLSSADPGEGVGRGLQCRGRSDPRVGAGWWSGEEVALLVSDKMCLRILRALQWEPDKALGFFRWAAGREENGYKHSSTTYNAMVRILGKSGLVGQFWDLVKEKKSEGFDIDIDTYIKLFRHFRKKRMMNEAVELSEMMMMRGPYKPSAHDCGDLLRQFSMCDDVQNCN